jgi:hypothetical protein
MQRQRAEAIPDKRRQPRPDRAAMLKSRSIVPAMASVYIAPMDECQHLAF